MMTDFPAKTKPVSSLLVPEPEAVQVSVLPRPWLLRAWTSQFMEILLLQRFLLLELH